LASVLIALTVFFRTFFPVDFLAADFFLVLLETALTALAAFLHAECFLIAEALAPTTLATALALADGELPVALIWKHEAENIIAKTKIARNPQERKS